MKKTTSILLIIIMAFSVSACQPAPENPIVIQKDIDRMVEQAQETPKPEVVAVPLAERYGIPTHLQVALEGAEGVLQVIVDAPVIAPQKALPIVRVRAAQFQQEQVAALWNALCGDLEMVELIEQSTKAQIQEQILNVMQQKEAAENGMATTNRPSDYYDRRIASLQEQYAAAPEHIDYIPMDGTLKEYTNEFPGSPTPIGYWGVNAMSKDGNILFQVRNDRNNTVPLLWKEYNQAGNETGTASIPLSRTASINYTDHTRMTTFAAQDAPQMVDKKSKISEETQGLLKLSPEEAIHAVEKFLNEACVGVRMQVSEMYLVNNRNTRNDVPEATQYAYRTHCTRVVNDLPLSYCDGASGNTKDSMVEAWYYEQMNLLIDDSGIFFLEWIAPIEVMDIVVKDSSMLPFSDIEGIFKNMIRISNEAKIQEEEIETLKMSVDCITLALQRVVEHDTFDQGLLIPVWNFHGAHTVVHSDGWVETIVGSILTVNAVDGSIIDVNKGY